MSDLDDLDRAQREAYFKGELESQSRLPMFLPQDPLSGAALQESERIEEETWRMQVEAENLLDLAEEQNVRARLTEQQKAQHALHMINQAGGELSPQALDDWLDWVAQTDPTVYDHPVYEQKAGFYSWLRDMEDVAQGRRPQPRSYKMPEPPEDEKREREERKMLQKERGAPQPFPGLTDSVRPEGIEVG